MSLTNILKSYYILETPSNESIEDYQYQSSTNTSFWFLNDSGPEGGDITKNVRGLENRCGVDGFVNKSGLTDLFVDKSSKTNNASNNYIYPYEEHENQYSCCQKWISPQCQPKLGQKLSFELNNSNIDLIQNLCLVVESPIIKELAHYYQYQLKQDPLELIDKLIKCIKLEIGGSSIDNLYSGHSIRFFNQVERLDFYCKFNQKSLLENGKFYLPIPFDNTTNNNYIPLRTMMYHTINIDVDLASINDLIPSNESNKNMIETLLNRNENINKKIIEMAETSQLNIKLKMDCIYLTNEKRRHILSSTTHRLPFYHPISGLLIYFKDNNNNLIKDDVFEYCNIFFDSKLAYHLPSEVLKYEGLYHLGHQYEDKWNGYYWLAFSRINDGANKTFSTINFSRINDAVIKFKFNQNTIDKYDTINIDIIARGPKLGRHISGMYGLAYCS